MKRQPTRVPLASIRAMLEKHGWVRVTARKTGCFKIVEWLDVKTNQVMRQAQAVEVQRWRTKNPKASPVPAAVSPVPSGTATAGAASAVAFPATLPLPGYGVGWN